MPATLLGIRTCCVMWTNLGVECIQSRRCKYTVASWTAGNNEARKASQQSALGCCTLPAMSYSNTWFDFDCSMSAGLCRQSLLAPVLERVV